MTGVEFLEQARRVRAGRQARVAHRVRRHRRRDQGDQRHRARLLPAQAVGPARGAAVSRARRPVERLARARTRTTRAGCGSSGTAGRSAATRSRRSSRATTCRTAGSISSATTKRSGCTTSRTRSAADLPLVLVPDGEPLRAPSTLDRRRRARPAHERRAAAVRPVHRRRRTGRARRRGVRRVGGIADRRRRTRGAGRAGRRRARRSRTTSGSRRACPAPTSPTAPSPRRGGSARRWCSPATSSASRNAGPVAAVRFGDGTEIEARTVLVATGVSYRLLEAPGLDELDGSRRVLRRDRERGPRQRGRRRVHRRRRQLGRPGRAEPRAASPDASCCSCGPTRWRSRCRSTSSSASSAAENIEVRLQTEVIAAAAATTTSKSSRSPTAARAPRRTSRRTGCSSSSAHHRAPTGSATSVARDERGFVITGPGPADPRRSRPRWPLDRAPFALETSVPGVFAAGDVRLDSMKRVASAVGEGAMSVYLVHRYLATI